MPAGDNVGASLFASSVQEDKPTIDVLNAADLDTSAVGDHGFDRGFADLDGRVKKAADWTYLGANVYKAGTTRPVLPSHEVVKRGGLEIGVVGVVTQETPSLVSPAGVKGIDLGDPVTAVNRVAEQLSRRGWRQLPGPRSTSAADRRATVAMRATTRRRDDETTRRRDDETTRRR